MTHLAALLAQAEDNVDPVAVLPILYLVLEWAIRIVLIPIVVHKHRAAEALAWLALVLFQPIPGAIIYLVLGRNLLGRSRIRKHARAVELVETPQRIAALGRYAAPEDTVEPQHRDLVRLARQVGHMSVLAGNSGTAMESTRQTIDNLINDIHHAEHHVHLLYYIFRDDDTGRRVADAVARAAQRGVTCRLLADAHGSSRMLKTLAPRLRKEGVDVRAALPVHVLRRGLARIDVRNHRKLAIIDGRIAYAGSQNICDPDYGHATIGAWHDLTARLTGPVVYQLQLLFAEDWAAETGAIPDSPDVFPEPQATGDTLVQTVPSGPGHRNQAFRDLVLSAINEANHRVVMATPYFIPDPPTQLALVLRAMAGVRLDIIVPEKTNSPLVNAAAKSAFAELLRAGANIHLHREGLLHVKAVTIDNSFAVFGSGNFDRRSFSLNYELNLLLLGSEVTWNLRNHLETYISESRPLTLRKLDARPRIQRIADDAAKLFGPLL